MLEEHFYTTNWGVSDETLMIHIMNSERVRDAYSDLEDAIIDELEYAKRNFAGGAGNPYNPYAGKYM